MACPSLIKCHTISVCKAQVMDLTADIKFYTPSPFQLREYCSNDSYGKCPFLLSSSIRHERDTRGTPLKKTGSIKMKIGAERKEQRMNCWEFMKCGRETGGINVKEFGSCPAYPYQGRHCARAAGTLCGGKIQGTFAVITSNCLKCDFYRSEHYDRTYRNSSLLFSK